MKANLLLDKLPSAIDVDGTIYQINTDFRACIKFEQMIFDIKNLSENEKRDNVIRSLNLFLKSIPPAEHIKPVMDGLIDFYRCEKEVKKLNSAIKVPQTKTPKIFDYEYDAPYIYAAFVQVYNIDLIDVKMHWYKFRALFDALPADCQFAKIMSYRGTDTSQIKNKNEKQRIEKLKNIYALPNALSDEEKRANAGIIFRGGG